MSALLRRVKPKKNRKPDPPEAIDPEAIDPEATEAEAADDVAGADASADEREDAEAADVEDDTAVADDEEMDADEDAGDEDSDDPDPDPDPDPDAEEEDGEDDEFAFDDDDDLEEEEASAAPRVRSRSARQILVVLALVALVLSGAVFYLLNRLNDARATEEAGDAAVAAARAHAQDLLSYDYRNLDSDFARGLAATTGGFHDQYKKTTGQLVKPRAAKQRVIVQAAVMNAGLVSAHEDNAVVLVFVDRVTTKSGQKKPAFDQDRVRMSLTKVNGKWLVSKLDAL